MNAFAQDILDKVINGGAPVGVAVILVMTTWHVIGSVGSHRHEEWSHALIKPIALCVLGIGLILAVKAAAPALIAGV